MSGTVFRPVRENPDLDILAEPQEPWDRVAVCSVWNDASRARRDWLCASVIAPLRGPRGLDELVRNLLANPQIRIVVVDGPDHTPDQQAYNAISGLWNHGTHREAVREDVRGFVPDIVSQVRIVRIEGDLKYQRDLTRCTTQFGDSRGLLPRTAPVGVYPPPAPEPQTSVPHGDPGDRIAADALSDLHPRIVRHIMATGRSVATQYGNTKELLNLVTVIRDPAAAAAELANDPQTQAYFRRLTVSEELQGVPYTYGSRLQGMGVGPDPYDPREPACWRSVAPDQVARIKALLGEKRDTRAAYLTTWRPAEDSGLESNRPCLVSVWFRVVQPTGPEYRPAELHVAVTFRSHDMLKGYPQNLAGVCMWVVAWARDLGLKPGSVTCTSLSAHIYEKDFVDAQALVKKYRRNGLRWDPRSTWRVEVLSDVCEVCRGRGRVDLFQHGECWDCDPRREDHQEGGPETPHCVCMADLDEQGQCTDRDNPTDTTPCKAPECAGTGRVNRRLRAAAMTPDGAQVTAIYEARSPAGLRAQIEESGLIQEVGNALWLGSEIERAAREGACDEDHTQ